MDRDPSPQPPDRSDLPSKTIAIDEIPTSGLVRYACVPSAFTVETVLAIHLIDDGLGGVRFQEERVQPYVKDYDVSGETPVDWPLRFDVRNWGFLLATDGEAPIGGAAIAYNTGGVDMLEGRSDLAVLWDFRVHPSRRGQGVGRRLFEAAVDWSRRRACRRLKIETQNVNVPACRFYRSMGCTLGAVLRYGYSAPCVAHEVMLHWYYEL